MMLEKSTKTLLWNDLIDKIVHHLMLLLSPLTIITLHLILKCKELISIDYIDVVTKYIHY